MIAILFSWLFFVLLNAYYGGALTMFFSTSPDIPFQNIREGIALYPKWKWIVINGDEAQIQSRSDAGDKDFAFYWDKVQDQTNNLVALNHIAALKELSIPGNYLFSDKMSLVYVIKDKPEITKSITPVMISSKQSIESCLLYPKNSPYTKMLNEGIQRLIQNGAVDSIIKFWVGNIPPSQNEGDAEAIGGKEIVFLFVTMGSAILLSFLVFLAELLYKLLQKLFGNQIKNTFQEYKSETLF